LLFSQPTSPGSNNRVNRRTLKLALYDRRFRVYAAARTLISAAVANRGLNHSEIQVFLAETKEADFLFKPAVATHLIAMYKKANEFHALNARVAELPIGDALTAVVKQERGVMEWFEGQPAELAKLVAPYLDFRKVR
jgi:hypothetical protein